MKFPYLVAAAVAILPATVSTDAFAPKAFAPRKVKNLLSTASVIAEIPTTPIAGMKPGTSGLRKKVEVWQGVDKANKNYVENFIQSLLDTAVSNNGGKMLDT
jgi:phosphoglucomutase